MNSIWQAIRLHFGFQTSGAHFLDFADLKLEPDENNEDLFQRLMAFVDDNLMTVGGGISHHGEFPAVDEDLSPSLENMIVLHWLKLIHQDLPRLVKQRYGSELRSRTLASLKPEISQAISSLLDEIHSISETKIMRQATYNHPRRPTRSGPARYHPQNQRTQLATKPCPLCKQAGRTVYDHYLSTCKYLPEHDRLYISSTRIVTGLDNNDSAEEEQQLLNDNYDQTQGVSMTCRVNTKQSPFFKAFYLHNPLRLTLDSGAETNMIRETVAKSIGAKICKSSQLARQADGLTPLKVIGETHLVLSRGGTNLHLDALVVEDLDVEVLAGTPFLVSSDISIRPAKSQITIGETVIHYGDDNANRSQCHTVRRVPAYVLRAPASSTTVWPGDYIELSIPSVLDDFVVAVEPRNDYSPLCHQNWPEPAIVEAVGDKIRLVNTSGVPLKLRRNEHFCQVRHTVDTTTYSDNTRKHNIVNNVISRPVDNTTFSDNIELDRDNLLTDDTRKQFRDLHRRFDSVFDPTIVGYNGHVGPFTATVNMGPVLPPQRKGRCPQYARDKLVELQDKFDELEAVGVFRRPEDIGVAVEYLNPSFLVRKSNGGSRLVTAFTEVGRYSKPQPSLMPDVDSTLRSIACWKYIVVSDLTSAFYQIPLATASRKYCGVVTPFRGVRVHTLCYGDAWFRDGSRRTRVSSLGRSSTRGCGR